MEIKPFKTLEIIVITLSDRASAGEYEDKSGPLIKQMLSDYLTKNNWKWDIEIELIPDDPQQLRSLIVESVTNKADAIFTTGGTGIGPRDKTPEIIRSFLHKEIPGIMEAIRLKHYDTIPNAVLSRSVAGTIGKTIVYSLPGSDKAVKSYMEEILKTFEHTLFMINGIDIH